MTCNAGDDTVSVIVFEIAAWILSQLPSREPPTCYAVMLSSQFAGCAQRSMQTPISNAALQGCSNVPQTRRDYRRREQKQRVASR